MNKVILADSHEMFRAGAAKALATAQDMQIIAQCADVERTYHAIAMSTGSVVLFASSLQPDLSRLRMLLEATGSRGIVIVENYESAGIYLHQGFSGVVFRSVKGQALVECVREVASWEIWIPPQIMGRKSQDGDMPGSRVRDRLAPKEARNVALIVPRDIAGAARDRPPATHEARSMAIGREPPSRTKPVGLQSSKSKHNREWVLGQHVRPD